jgi:hypothetical protein
MQVAKELCRGGEMAEYCCPRPSLPSTGSSLSCNLQLSLTSNSLRAIFLASLSPLWRSPRTFSRLLNLTARTIRYISTKM